MKVSARIVRIGVFAGTTLLLAGCLNDIQGPEGSHVWVADRTVIEHYRGDDGEALDTLHRQAGVWDMAADTGTGLLWVIRKDGSLASYNHAGERQNELHVELAHHRAKGSDHRDDGHNDRHDRDDKHDKRNDHRRDRDDDHGHDRNDGSVRVEAQLRAHQGLVWLAQRRSLVLIGGNIQQWQRDLPDNLVDIALDRKNNRLWLATGEQLLAYEADGGLFREITLPAKGGGKPRSVAYDETRERIILVSSKNLYRYALDGRLEQQERIRHGRWIVSDPAGNLWLAEDRQLFKFDPLTLKVLTDVRLEEPVRQVRRDPFNAGIWVLGESALGWIDGEAQPQGRLFVDRHARIFAVSYEDAQKPRLSFVQPQDQAVVGSNPEFVLQASDNIRVDPATFAFEVNTQPVTPACLPDSTTEDRYRCTLPSPLSSIASAVDGRYTVSATVDDPAGNRSEPAVINVFLDTDGDGVHDGDDAFPANPEEWSDIDNDDIGDNSDPDRDGDGIGNDYEVQVGTDPNNPNDAPPDLDSDGIPDSLDDDRDGDGVDNGQDVFPDDAGHSVHPPVTGLGTQLQIQHVQLTWQAPAVTDLLAGYHVYRADFGADNFARLNNDAFDETSFTDTSVVNGAAYRYRVVAVANGGTEGQAGDVVNFFVAFNNTIVAVTEATRIGFDAHVQWQAAAGVTYRLYRSEGSTFPTLLGDLTTNDYLDSAALWNTAYTYRVKTVRTFSNPISGQTDSIEGPEGSAAALDPVPPLTVSLDDAVSGTDGVLEITHKGGGDAGISGAYQNAVGAVTVSAQSSAANIDATASDGRYRLVLPNTPETWTLTVSEPATPPRNVSLTFRLIADTTPPLLSLDGQPHVVVNDEFFTVRGQSSDTQSGIASIRVASNRFPNIEFAAILEENDGFSAEIPLEVADNILTVTATDGFGNTAQAQRTVRREISAAPRLEITQPVNGAMVTDARISLSGVLYTSLVPDQIRLRLGGQLLFPESASSPGVYPFTFDNIDLSVGLNNLLVQAETTAGSASAVVAVIRRDTPDTPAQPGTPVIQITTPVDGTVTNRARSLISGTVQAVDGPVSLTVNGNPLDLFGLNHTGGSFTYLAELDGLEGEIHYKLVATDGNNAVAERTVTIVRDTIAPAIEFASAGLQSPPAANTVRELPYQIQGSVTDTNLASLTVNGRPLQLLTGASAGQYTFAAGLELPPGTGQSVIFEARDRAGNSSGDRELLFDVDPAVGIEIISPRDGSEIAAQAGATQIAVTARLQNLAADHRVLATIGDGAAADLVLDGNVATAIVLTDLTDGEHTLRIQVLDALDNVVSQRQSRFTLVNVADAPLAVMRSEPANDQGNFPTNQAVTVYFNRPIDPNLITVNVKETMHGLDYDLTNQKAKGFGELPQPQLVEVHRSMEDVGGALFYGQDNRFVTFHAERNYGFDAQLFVEVGYDGETLTRFNFTTEPLPTLLTGSVVDQMDSRLAGITVSLPELGAVTQTKPNGNFNLRIDTQNRPVRNGRYRIVYNGGLANPRYGSHEGLVDVQAGRLNQLGRQILLQLSSSIPFVTIAGGQGEARLADGDLILELNPPNRLVFPNGRNSGPVHVQFTTFSELGVRVDESATPLWMYAVQPVGIRVEGPVGLRINMPSLYGSYDYIPDDGTYVVLLGYDAGTGMILPVGAGRIEDRQVSSVGKLHLDNLNYLGYAFAPGDGQTVLARYADNEIGTLAELRSELSKYVGQ